MKKALGLIETIGLVAAVEAADAAVKSANISLLGYENSRGGGMITIKLAGDVGAVKAGVAAGVAAAERVGQVAANLVIPRPHEEIEVLIKNLTRGKGLEETKPAKPIAKPKTTKAAAKPKTTRRRTTKSSAAPKKAAPKKTKETKPAPADDPKTEESDSNPAE